MILGFVHELLKSKTYLFVIILEARYCFCEYIESNVEHPLLLFTNVVIDKNIYKIKRSG